MSAYFITATGTEIGKTVLTTALAWQLKQAGRNVVALKPVISGFEDDNPEVDTAQIAASLGLPLDQETINTISPFRFRDPISPNLAAAREGKEINPEKLLDFCDRAMASFDVTLIEGIGGTHVPVAKDFLVADWILDLDIPAVLVTGSYLGALSHTLVTVEALQAMGVKIQSIVVSQSADEPMRLEETVAALIDEIHDVPIFALPRIKAEPLYEHAPDMRKVLA
jgi:dethiobiotin synthetase